jgi:hypothetical protein
LAKKYGVAEITQTEGVMEVEQRGEVDLGELRDQLREIRDAINPIITEVPADGALGLESLVISLTVGYQGTIMFIVGGSVEASITLTFSRPNSS